MCSWPSLRRFSRPQHAFSVGHPRPFRATCAAASSSMLGSRPGRRQRQRTGRWLSCLLFGCSALALLQGSVQLLPRGIAAGWISSLPQCFAWRRLLRSLRHCRCLPGRKDRSAWGRWGRPLVLLQCCPLPVLTPMGQSQGNLTPVQMFWSSARKVGRVCALQTTTMSGCRLGPRWVSDACSAMLRLLVLAVPRTRALFAAVL
mmetsp:Transcript_88714/g.276110  ORF Transcript_88714/g.276110 Transcript_88714/m.276110 type:complete len:202 (-) Transcript_88714:53-658(-)